MLFFLEFQQKTAKLPSLMTPPDPTIMYEFIPKQIVVIEIHLFMAYKIFLIKFYRGCTSYININIIDIFPIEMNKMIQIGKLQSFHPQFLPYHINNIKF